MVNYFTNKLRPLFSRQFDRWLIKRMPAKSRQTLSGKNIFILPSKFGCVFLFFVTLLFVLATNYQNNLILFFAYLLSSLFVSAMVHSFFNLKGLSVELLGEFHGYANENIAIPVVLHSQKMHLALTFHFINQAELYCQQTDLTGKPTKLMLSFSTSSRGVKSLERLVITSEYSLGLFKCWTKLAFPVSAVVYPQPLPFNQQQNIDIHHQNPDENNGNSANISRQSGADEFIELANYRAGEPLSKVAWKHLAKGQGWYSKQYGLLHSNIRYYALQDMPASGVEKKLQMLCYLVLLCHQKGDTFGILLGKQKLTASNGRQHLQDCLTELAKYQQAYSK